MAGDLPITFADVVAAAAVLEGVAHRTPVLRSRTLDARTGATVLLKCEPFQRGGAFKFRGAYTKLAALHARGGCRGVVAFSSGNHAQAVAMAARELGLPAVIVMPSQASALKRAATEGYGARVVAYDLRTGDRDAISAGLVAETGYDLVPPFDDPWIMAGQGTAALELASDAGPLDVVVAPVGGGGLVSGTAVAVAGAGVRIVGVEPAAGDDGARSLAAGHRVKLDAVPETIADGQQVTVVGELPFAVMQALVDAIVTVTDDEIAAAMAFLFERLKLVVEPSGACGVAALLEGRIPDVAGRRVGVIVSGGNVDLSRFAELTATVRGRQSVDRS
jgi:threo-3-hydroxy-L-aspartate ammonia-lyase